MDKWQASFFGLKQLPHELSDFEIQAFFMFNEAERLSIEALRQPALKLALQIGFLRMSGRLLHAVRMHRAINTVEASRRTVRCHRTGFGLTQVFVSATQNAI